MAAMAVAFDLAAIEGGVMASLMELHALQTAPFVSVYSDYTRSALQTARELRVRGRMSRQIGLTWQLMRAPRCMACHHGARCARLAPRPGQTAPACL